MEGRRTEGEPLPERLAAAHTRRARLAEEVKQRAASRRNHIAVSQLPYSDNRWRSQGSREAVALPPPAPGPARDAMRERREWRQTVPSSSPTRSAERLPHAARAPITEQARRVRGGLAQPVPGMVSEQAAPAPAPAPTPASAPTPEPTPAPVPVRLDSPASDSAASAAESGSPGVEALGKGFGGFGGKAWNWASGAGFVENHAAATGSSFVDSWAAWARSTRLGRDGLGAGISAGVASLPTFGTKAPDYAADALDPEGAGLLGSGALRSDGVAPGGRGVDEDGVGATASEGPWRPPPALRLPRPAALWGADTSRAIPGLPSLPSRAEAQAPVPVTHTAVATWAQAPSASLSPLSRVRARAGEWAARVRAQAAHNAGTAAARTASACVSGATALANACARGASGAWTKCTEHTASSGATCAASAQEGCAAAGQWARKTAASEGVRGAVRGCLFCLVIVAIVLSYPVAVVTNYLSLVCARVRVQTVSVAGICNRTVTVEAGVEIVSPSRFGVEIADLTAELRTARGLPLASVAVPGTFRVQRGERVHAATVSITLLDSEELIRTLHNAAAALDARGTPLDQAYAAAALLVAQAPTDAEAAGGANGTDALADADGIVTGPFPSVPTGADASRGAPPGRTSGAGAGGAAPFQEGESVDEGSWHLHIGLDLRSRVVLGVPLGGRVRAVCELSEDAARKMRETISAIQRTAGCGAKCGLDVGADAAPGLSAWPPDVRDVRIGEVSRTGIHVSATLSLNVTGPLAVEEVPALSMQLCSSPDPDRAPTGLGLASSTINHAVSSLQPDSVNWTRAQLDAYREAHSFDEGCIATVATQPFRVAPGVPFDLKMDLAMPFFGNSSSRFYGPLYFAEEISRGGALVVRGSSDAEIASLGSSVFNGTYIPQEGRASSACVVQRVLQEMHLQVHPLRILPSGAPYLRDSLLGASCMAGVFLHYFSHDNITELNEDRVLEDCFAFMETSVGMGLDPRRASVGAKRGAAHTKAASATFRPVQRDVSGRVLFRFEDAGAAVGGSSHGGGTKDSGDTAARAFAGAGGVDSACRWLDASDDSTHYYRVKSRVYNIANCEAECIRRADCWGIEFETASKRCELWNRQPRVVVEAPGFACYSLRATGFAFAPGAEARPEDVLGEDDGWDAVWARALNETARQVLVDALKSPPPDEAEVSARFRSIG